MTIFRSIPLLKNFFHVYSYIVRFKIKNFHFSLSLSLSFLYLTFISLRFETGYLFHYLIQKKEEQYLFNRPLSLSYSFSPHKCLIRDSPMPKPAVTLLLFYSSSYSSTWPKNRLITTISRTIAWSSARSSCSISAPSIDPILVSTGISRISGDVDRSSAAMAHSTTTPTSIAKSTTSRQARASTRTTACMCIVTPAIQKSAITCGKFFHSIIVLRKKKDSSRIRHDSECRFCPYIGWFKYLNIIRLLSTMACSIGLVVPFGVSNF